MSRKIHQKPHNGFCIYINTSFQGAVPVVSDGNGKYVVFKAKLEAQREIADFMITRLQQFLDGEKDFDDAIILEEYIAEVDVFSDGTFVDADGNCFGADGERLVVFSRTFTPRGVSSGP